MEWLANLKPQYVVFAVVVLAAIRFFLGKKRSRAARQVAELAESLAVALALVFLVIRPFIVQAFFIPSGSMRPTLLEHDHLLVNKFIYRFKEPQHGDIIVFRSPPNASQDGAQRDFIKRVIGVPGDRIQVRGGWVEIGEKIYEGHEGREDLRALLGGEAGEGDVWVKLERDRVLVNGRQIDKRELAAAADEPGARVEIHPGAVIRNGRELVEPYIAEDPESDMVDPETGELKTVIVGQRQLFVMGDNRNDSNDSRAWGPLGRERVLGKAMFIFWPLGRIRWIK